MKFVACLLALIAPITAEAVSYTYTPSPADLNDLDHHLAYTWRIDNVNLGGATISGATLTFANIANWDSNANMLFLHLLDTAAGSGVRSFTDATGAPVPVNQIADNFASPLVASNPLVPSGTGNTFLTSRSFTTTPITYTYTFTAAQLAALQSYIANGNNFALAFDPDCHYFNNGITFTFAVPETSSTVALLSLALILVGAVHLRGHLGHQRKARLARVTR